MYVVLDAYISQFGHKSILQLKLFEALCLLRKQKLQSIDHHYMHIVFLNRVDNGREDFFDIMRAVEVHKVQGKPLEFIGNVLESTQVFV